MKCFYYKDREYCKFGKMWYVEGGDGEQYPVDGTKMLDKAYEESKKSNPCTK